MDNPLTTNSLSSHSLYTHLPFVWLSGFQPLSLQGMTAKGCATKKISSFAEESATLCDPPHPPGDKLWALPLIPAGSQTPGLSSPTLLDGNPHGFSSTAKASLPARQAKKFCPKSLTVLKNPDIHTFRDKKRKIIRYLYCFVQLKI